LLEELDFNHVMQVEEAEELLQQEEIQEEVHKQHQEEQVGQVHLLQYQVVQLFMQVEVEVVDMVLE
jgi:hypothetical protein